MRSVRQILGTFVYDWPRLVSALARPGCWMLMRNRNDELSFSPDRSGVRCDWVHTRPLHLCDVFPITGRWLLRRAVQTHPIKMKDEPDDISDSPDISFLIGHRGAERLPHLLATLRSIAAQKNVSFECIVVEQDEHPVVQKDLPSWINYVHAPPSKSGMLYNRSQAFNAGARIARGRVLILHDNDILVPADYGAQSVRLVQEGYEVVQLKRFVFYLDRASSQHMRRPEKAQCEQVVENLCGGGSLAVSARAYDEIGGMDEEFVGWGGEDEEFWDRCLTQNVWEYGSLPFIHLWHEPQPGKRAVHGQGAQTAELTARRRAMPVEQRIAELVARRGGTSQ